MRTMFRILIQLILAILLAATQFASGSSQDEDMPLTSRYTGAIPTHELVQLMYSGNALTNLFVAYLAAERGAESVPELLDVLRRGNEMWTTRMFGPGTLVPISGAFWAIRKIRDTRSIPTLVELFKDEQYKHRYRALGTLKQFGSHAVDPLLDLLKQAKGEDRQAVIRNLVEIDDPRVARALQDVVSHKDDPSWWNVTNSLAMRKDEAGRSIRRLALSDPDIAGIILWDVDDKMLLPIYFKHARSNDEMRSLKAMLGIARNAGKAELSRIVEEGLDKTWVMPFVEINCAIEGVDSESEKANILWQYVIVPEYRLPGDSLDDGRVAAGGSISGFYYPDLPGLSPIGYAIEKLVELGDAALPILEAGMKSDKEHIRVRAIMTLAQTPPSEASTELLLKVWDNPIYDDNWELDLIALEYVVNELGDRKEKRAVPKLLKMLNRMGEAETGEEVSAMFSAIAALGRIGDKRAWDEMLEIWTDLDPGPDKQKEPRHNPARCLKSASAAKFAEVFNEWKIAEPALIPLMVAAILDECLEGELHRTSAFQTLVRIGNPSIETLKQLSKSEHQRLGRFLRELAETSLKVLLWPHDIQ
jgi:HEAT repeat protein